MESIPLVPPGSVLRGWPQLDFSTEECRPSPSCSHTSLALGSSNCPPTPPRPIGGNSYTGAFPHPTSISDHRLVLPSSVQPLSRVRLLVTPWTAARQASLSITNWRSCKQADCHCKLVNCHHTTHLRGTSLPTRIFTDRQGKPAWVFSIHQVLDLMCKRDTDTRCFICFAQKARSCREAEPGVGWG